MNFAPPGNLAASPLSGVSLGPALQAALVNACRESHAATLTDIRWFRSDWQRGGGSTASAIFEAGTGPMEVVVKLPVGPVEFRWTTGLSAACEAMDASTPRVLASGQTLNGYDLGWLVIEKLPGLPIGARLDAQGIEDILIALADFHDRAARCHSVVGREREAPAPDWEKLLHKSRDVIHHGKLANAQKWNHAVHDVQKHLPQLLRRWEARHINTWCHGDLHPGNAMRRATACALENGSRPKSGISHLGPAVLLDMALVHPGHWVEDALYFERVYWGRKEQLRTVNLVSTLARIRRHRRHDDHEDYGMLANVRRVLSAAAAPGLLEREGNPRYLAHALDLIHRLLPQVGQ